MKKKIISLCLAIVLFCSMIPTALAAPAGLGNFKQIKTYSDDLFTDLVAGQWYVTYIQKAYELGLMKGASGTNFNPNGNITIAETLALACRLHDIYNGGSGELTQGAPWYQVYVDYAVENSIIPANKYSNYMAQATRIDFATILCAAFPETALPAINNIAAIPDVPGDADYTAAVLRLYNAGILTGSDNYGSFRPSSNIMRSEVATIVTRMADAGLRKTFTLLTPTFTAKSTGQGTDIVISWEAFPNAKGYVIMAGITSEIDPENWSQAGICSADVTSFEVPDDYYGDDYWAILALNYDPVEDYPENAATIAQSNVVTIPESAYEVPLPSAKDYAYLAGADFRSVRRDYPGAQAQHAYVVVYENSDGELCVLTHVRYKIISNYSVTTLHNITTGRSIKDPYEYYSKYADRYFGANRIKYMNYATEALSKEIVCLNALSSILSTGKDPGTGAYVDARTLNL